jgi:hypothetical protein
MNCEAFLHAFVQTAGRAWVEIHQFSMEKCQSALGIVVVARSVSAQQFLSNVSLVILNEVIDNVSYFVNLAALNESGLSSLLLDRGRERLPTIQDIKTRNFEITTPLLQIVQ